MTALRTDARLWEPPPAPEPNCYHPAPRRIVRADGTVLAEPSAADCHREFDRLAKEYPGEEIAAEYRNGLGWVRWLTTCKRGDATP